ncbi:MAG: queuosine precursor transporter [Saprospiraceae bacterium]
MNFLQSDKAIKLFIVLAGFFITNAVLAEFIGVKIFSLEQSLGIQAVSFSFFGFGPLSFNLTAGVLLWPIVFTLTDILNEYFGIKGVRFLSYLAVTLICFSFLVVFAAIRLVPADFWPMSHLDQSIPIDKIEVKNLNTAFALIFGQGLWIIFGSMVAFLIGQILDVFIFHKVKEKTGDKKLWLRAGISTLISQFVDSYIVLFIAFYIGAKWSLTQVLAIGTMNYIYKFIVAILLIPVIYLVHFLIDNYLGKELSQAMRTKAMLSE